MGKIKSLTVLIFGIFWLGTTAQATILGVEGGKLLSVFDLSIAGKRYDVKFVPGTCAEVFNGCNGASGLLPDRDFAEAAQAALRSEILIDSAKGNFDSNPGLVANCDPDGSRCDIAMPFHEAWREQPYDVWAAVVNNSDREDRDRSESFSITPDYNPNEFGSGNFAVFTPAPTHLNLLTLARSEPWEAGNSRLIGARNVEINGALYNVSFDGGTCIEVFNGCNAARNFAGDRDFAVAAARALLNTVYVDGPAGNFDSDPSQVATCSDYCYSFIPYLDPLEVFGPIGFVQIENSANEEFDHIADRTRLFPDSALYSTDHFVRFERVSGVPDPDIWAMMIAGFTLCGGAMRRQRMQLS
jgi:hypothetical protein